MGLWILWLVGLAITIVTSYLIHTKTKINRFYVDVLVAVSIALVGGIAEGWAICLYKDSDFESNAVRITFTIILTVLTTAAIWVVGAPILGIFKKKQFRTFEIIIFILVFIIASAYWTQIYTNYNDNIEDINETVVISKQENQLLYFCNIPVQQVSGTISGDVSGSILWTDGDISGSISTSEKLPYWFLNEDNEGIYNSVSVDSSKIKFIENNETPYVEVITYQSQTRTVNHNNGEETIVIGRKWKEYIFYLPQAIMQYSLE